MFIISRIFHLSTGREIFFRHQRQKVRDFFIKFKKTSHFADFFTEQTLDFVLCHFGACEIYGLRGKALNRAAQIAKAVGALGAFAFLQILLSVLQTLQLVLFLCKLRLGSFLFGSKLVEGFRFCHCA